MKKQVLSILLALCLTLTLLPMAAFAEGEEEAAPPVEEQQKDPVEAPTQEEGTTEPENTVVTEETVVPEPDDTVVTKDTTVPENTAEGGEEVAAPASTSTPVAPTEAATELPQAESGVITLDKDVVLAKALHVTDTLVIDGAGHTITASSEIEFQTGSDSKAVSAVIWVSDNGELTLKNVTLDANKVSRAILCKDNSKLTIDGATVTGGHIEDSYVAGVYMTDSSVFTMTGGEISGNTIEGAYANDNYCQYSADLRVGANATGAINTMDGGHVGSMFVNSNEYSAKNPGAFTMNDGTVDNLYVEYDKGFGGSFTYKDGTLHNFYLSTTTNGKGVKVTPTKGVNYFGGHVAVVGKTSVPSIKEAVAKVDAENQTITLLTDVTTAFSLRGENKTIILDLNHHTLSGPTSADAKGSYFGPLLTRDVDLTVRNGVIESTIGKEGIKAGPNTKLTVEETATIRGSWGIAVTNTLLKEGETKSTSGTGTVINVYGTIEGKAVPGDNQEGAGGITINGNLNSTADNTYAKIHLFPSAVIKGVHGTSTDANKADGAAIYAAGYGEWTIDEGATLTGDEALSIKSGKFIINGGTLTAKGPYSDPATSWSNGTEATGAAISVTTNNSYAKNVTMDITGGTFKSEKGYAFYESGTTSNEGTAFAENGLKISAGSFSGKEGAVYSQKLTKFISGGLFSSDPSKYAVEGQTGVASNNAEYPFTIGTKPENAAEVVPAPPAVEAKLPDSASADEKKAADAVADALTAEDSKLAVSEAPLAAAAKDVAIKNTVAKETVLEDVKKLDGNNTITADSVAIVVQPYLDIKVTDVKIEGAEKTLTLDITPMYKTVATTQTVAEDPAAEIKTDGKTPNAVEVAGQSGKLEVSHPVTITIPLPDDFTTAEKLTIKHVKSSGKVYYYEAAVAGDKQSATFTVTHGFSGFTIQAADTRKLTIAFDSGVAGNPYSITDVGVATLPTASKTDYTFNGWKINGALYTELTDALWAAVMTGKTGDQTVSAQAQFTKNPSGGGDGGGGGGGSSSGGGGGSSSSSTYTVSLPSKFTGGKVTANYTDASEGTIVTLTVKADGGYVLDELTVTDKNGKELKLKALSGNRFSFTMPKSKVEIEASFITGEEESLPFADVAEGYWAYDQIAWAFENGYMNGSSATAFNPGGAVSRQQLWMILSRLNGATPADFAAAKTWAVNAGVSDGSQPGGAVSRQQLVTILYRYAQLQGYDVSAAADLGAYPDSATVAEYARDAMAWAVKTGIVGGTAAGTLDPAGTATRAQFAVILSRFCEAAGI